ncbi:aldehyde dehydrogenase family protein [Halomonas urmiana]|uniref:aldehyde dehydrogenase (NAD(+)) n=1 Tax=Halomonas urmiana TaxID=490901 RepID=A0A5R8MJL2_9GAMM|nr:aldehyde dehydrogenase family protein [Halomonas urmiana]TLF50566.1 aldehyde dehydrogenase family protein [Halomonas urmiana]
MIHHNELYMAGKWTTPQGKATIEVVSPSTEAVIASVPAASAQDVSDAVEAAKAALTPWSQTTPEQRAAFLQQIHDGLKARKEEIGRTIAAEMGMPLKMATRIQASLPIASFGMYAKLLAEFPFEETVGNSLVTREPVGVVGCITPWNYPLHQTAAKVAAALAAGCSVVLKPSEVAPLNAFILAEVIHDTGLPAGAFNLVTGHGPEAGEALVTHPDVDMISFTGSTTAGKRISALAADTIKRVALELGGKSAAVLMEDADFPTAVKATVNNCFLNSGQNCNALTRMLVPEHRYEEAAELARDVASSFTLGDPLSDAGKLGPVASKVQQERVQAYIRTGLEEGAELLIGGAEPPAELPKGCYVQPTILGRVMPHSTMGQEEIFGPVLSIITYRDEDEAVRIANDTRYGLAGAVWSASEERAMTVARKLRAGQVDINGAPFNLYAPFGGFKQSGHGRELGRYGLEEFLEYKSIQRP